MPFCRFSTLIAVVWVSTWSATAFGNSDGTLDEIELEFLQIINEYREANGAPCLTPSPTMNEAADFMSRSMGELGFFDHQEPPCDAAGDNCTGRDPFERIAFFGHSGWSTAGENIAAGYPDAVNTFEGWKASPGHNENMLNPNFTAIGIGRVVVPNSSYGVYWTNNFSNFVDGSGDCDGGSDSASAGIGGEFVGVSDGASDPMLGELAGKGCQSLGGMNSALLGLLWWVLGLWRRRV